MEPPDDRAELKLWYLKRVEFFQHLPDEEIDRLKRQSTMQEHPPRTYVYFLPEDLRDVYVLKRGYVEIGYHDHRAHEFIAGIFGQHEFFGALSMGASVRSFARTLTDVCLCRIDKREFSGLLSRHPSLALQVIARQSEQIQLLETRMLEEAFEEVRFKLYRLLLLLYERFGRGEDELLTIPLTHEEIAHHVGCARETASTYLSALKKEGVIDYSKRNIRVCNPMWLKARLCEASVPS